ncbi:MAG: LysE/ArgO family amino acid transporter [Propionibacteriales bacterium]|nr:LysE/ArgO family amino acid transporter [Propionibacteriales bacterium]
MTATLTGLLSGLTLIIAIGAQNAYVLKQGLLRQHVGVVMAICILSDAVLIMAGVSGVGVLVDRFPVVLVVLRWLGAAYLLGYGLYSLWSARTAHHLDPSSSVGRSVGAVAGTTVALTWLNPHVYLDTVVLLGSLANQQGPDGRWLFGAGAVAGSVMWFLALGLGARALSRWLARPITWRILDVVIGVVMILLAVRLALG